MKYEDRSLHGKEETRYSKLVLDFVKSIEKNTTLPEGFSKPLRLFVESENGRGLWKWVFERGYPIAVRCVGKEVLDGAIAYRFRLTAKAGLTYRLTAILDEKGEVTQLLWW